MEQRLQNRYGFVQPDWRRRKRTVKRVANGSPMSPAITVLRNKMMDLEEAVMGIIVNAGQSRAASVLKPYIRPNKGSLWKPIRC